MAWAIIVWVLLLVIAFALWEKYADSTNKEIIADLKTQLSNLIDTYNKDTTELNNKLDTVTKERHNLKQDVIKLKNDLIETKKRITNYTSKKLIMVSPDKPEVNNTNNENHAPRKRWRPRKY